MKTSTVILALCTLCFAACAGTPKKSAGCCSQQTGACCADGSNKACPAHATQKPAPKKSS